MYSFESWGVGVGRGAANGFQLLEACSGSCVRNHPVFFPVRPSVDGSQSFLAKTPKVTNVTNMPVRPARKLFRLLENWEYRRDMGAPSDPGCGSSLYGSRMRNSDRVSKIVAGGISGSILFVLIFRKRNESGAGLVRGCNKRVPGRVVNPFTKKLLE